MIRVLIVEDDPMVAELNKHYLKHIEGFSLQAVAGSVAEALELLKQQKFELILLDIFMPGLNGLDLLDRIREQGKGVDVIVVSAACDKQTIQRALLHGVVDYLIKPFEFERFQAALSAYRERVGVLSRKESFNQDELDRLIQKKEPGTVSMGLPKGLDRKTLAVIWAKIGETKGEAFSTDELANSAGITRVTMRKYLDFLTQIAVLKQEVVYGAVGRPVYKYRCDTKGSTCIKAYL